MLVHVYQVHMCVWYVAVEFSNYVCVSCAMWLLVASQTLYHCGHCHLYILCLHCLSA